MRRKTISTLLAVLLAALVIGFIQFQARQNARLLIAAYQGSPSHIESALRWGASIDHRGPHGEGPAIAAAAQMMLLATHAEGTSEYGAGPRYEDAVELLLQHGADPNLPDRRGYAALDYAAQTGKVKLVELLLTHGADIDSRNEEQPDPIYPLILAVKARDHFSTTRWQQNKVIRLLVERGATINATNASGRTALSYLAAQAPSYRDYSPLVELLLERGADTRGGQSDQFTPLHYAAAGGHPSTMRLLIAHGAEIDAKTIEGYTPIWWAARSATVGDEIAVQNIRLLIEAGANLNEPVPFGDPLLEMRRVKQALQQTDEAHARKP